MKRVSVRISAEIEVRHIPCPPEHEAEWHRAIHIIAEMILEEFEAKHADDVSPLCPECQHELHLTTEGKHVCRNETCPNYS